MRADRLNEMEQYILQSGTATLPDLSEHFGISINTVRRDINQLVTRGHVNKTYGGVYANSQMNGSISPLIPFSERVSINSAEKQIIGEIAADLVNDNNTIFLDSGSTTPCMVAHLAKKKNVTIVTHNLMVMYETAKYPSLNLLSIGGMYNHPTASFVDSALSLMGKIHLHALFMAATSVSAKWGIGNNTYAEFKFKKEIINRYDNIILLTDHSKFEKVASYSYCDFSALSAVVTDRKPTKNIVEALNSNGVNLLCPETIKEVD